MSTYQLGRLADGLSGLQDVASIAGTDPTPDETEFLEYTELVGVTLSGYPIEAGFPKVRWKWGMMPQANFDALMSYCTGAWSRVYIRTRVNSGTMYNFGVFKAIMTRPRAKTLPGRLRGEVEVIFTMLETP